jgi:phage terminase large subunit-like protein
MARSAKTLVELVRGESFRADRHSGLLAGPLVGPRELQALQLRWQQAPGDYERRAVALEYGRLVRGGTIVSERPVVDPGVGLAEFFASYLVHVKGQAAGQPFVLEGWQREFLDEFDRLDELGCRIYQRALLGVPRGCGKSPVAAGRALFDLVTKPDAPDVFCCAASRDQARLTFDYARGFASQGPLSELLDVGRHEIRNPVNGGVLKALAADGFVAHGLNPTSVTLDEIHAFRSGKQEELFTAIDTSLKRPDAHWLAITTATGDRGSLLGRLLAELQERYEVERVQRGLWTVRDEADGWLAYWYGANADDDFDDVKLWRQVNPASFVSIAALRKQRASPSMPKSTFARLHLNAPVASERELWIPMPSWDALADPDARIPADAACYLGLDGSRTFDTTVVAWASLADDDRVDVDARVFSARPDAPHHVLHEGGKINFDDVEAFILDRVDQFRVLEAAYDPRYLDRSAELLETRLQATAIFSVEPSSRLMRDALAAFERGVLDGVIRHRGDPVVAEHLRWCVADRADSGELRRVSKADRTRPIDAVVALALAYWRCSQGGGKSFYEDVPVLVLGFSDDDGREDHVVDGERVY